MMTIETERLVLRPLTLSDLGTAHEYSVDAEHTKYMIFLPNDTVQETEYFLQKAVFEWAKELPQFYEFAITLGGRHIGTVSISLSEDRQTGELGWIINKKYQGNGYVTEAAGAVLDFSVNTLCRQPQLNSPRSMVFHSEHNALSPLSRDGLYNSHSLSFVITAVRRLFPPVAPVNPAFPLEWNRIIRTSYKTFCFIMQHNNLFYLYFFVS